MSKIDAIDLMKDAMEMSNDYQMMLISGFRSDSKLIKILDGFMQKYGFTKDEALAVARGSITYAQFYHALRRGNEQVQRFERKNSF